MLTPAKYRKGVPFLRGETAGLRLSSSEINPYEPTSHYQSAPKLPITPFLDNVRFADNPRAISALQVESRRERGDRIYGKRVFRPSGSLPTNRVVSQFEAWRASLRTLSQRARRFGQPTKSCIRASCAPLVLAFLPRVRRFVSECPKDRLAPHWTQVVGT